MAQDAEMKALAAVLRTVEKLGPAAGTRVLQYAQSKLSERHQRELSAKVRPIDPSFWNSQSLSAAAAGSITDGAIG